MLLHKFFLRNFWGSLFAFSRFVLVFLLTLLDRGELWGFLELDVLGCG